MNAFSASVTSYALTHSCHNLPFAMVHTVLIVSATLITIDSSNKDKNHDFDFLKFVVTQRIE